MTSTFGDDSNIINRDVYELLKEIAHCSICSGIIMDPFQCLKCENSFCRKCLRDWLNKSPTCPFKCANSEFKECRIIRQMLDKLVFKCHNGCGKELKYLDLPYHDEVCGMLLIQCPNCASKVSKSQLKNFNFDIHEKIIEDLQEENESLKNIILNFDCFVPSMFRNSSKTFETPSGIKLKTITSGIPLPDVYSIRLRFSTLQYPGHLVVGFSDIIINEDSGFLGGDFGNGNWGLAGNGALGEEGQWSNGIPFSKGDILTLKLNKGIITYSVNDEPNNYSYTLLRSVLYFSMSFYYDKEVIELF